MLPMVCLNRIIPLLKTPSGLLLWAVDSKVKGEALTGVRTDQPLSGEISLSGTSTLLSEAEGHTEGGTMRQPSLGPAPSETLRTCGNSVHGNREIPQVPSPDGGVGRIGKAKSHTPVMKACGKSDACIVPKKPPNKGRANLSAEPVEERRAIQGKHGAAGHAPDQESAIEHRVADPRVLRLVRKWLRAGVSEDGQWSKTQVGTPQGAVASPLLANIYLHYVLDLWVNRYHAVSGNLNAMNTFRTEIIHHWFKTLRHRGQKRRINWERFNPIVKRWILVPTVQHPYHILTCTFTPNTRDRSPVR